LPTLLFRNIWTWWPGVPKPALRKAPGKTGASVVVATTHGLGDRFLYCERDVPLLFTENETNNQRIFGTPNTSLYVKDGINDYVVSGKHDAVNPDQTGTKASAHYQLTVEGGKAVTIWLRLSDRPPGAIGEPFGSQFAQVIQTRRSEADEFYQSITPN